MKYYQQFDSSDCGPACLAMIASHFGKSLNIAKVRLIANTSLDGTNLLGLKKASNYYGLNAKIVKGEQQSINKYLFTPFIAHIKNQNCNQNHYVVIKKISKNNIYIWNHDSQVKKIHISYKAFFDLWSGYAIFLEPDVTFSKSKNENLLLKFLPILLPHKEILFFSFLSSLLLLLFGITISFYYKYLFDEIIYSKSTFSLNSLSLGIIFVTIVQCIVNAIRSVLLSHFSYKTDLQLNFSYLSHILKLPLSFFGVRKSGEILSRLGDLEKIKHTFSTAVISGVMDFIMFLITGPILFTINNKLFIISFFSVLIVSFISIFFAKIYRNYYDKTMSQKADVNSYLYESLNGMSTIKALDAEEIVYDEYEKKKMTEINTSWTLNKYGITQNVISGLINGISSTLIYWIGFSVILDGKMSLGILITFTSLLTYFTGPFYRLINIQNSIQESLIAAKRVGEILELECEKQKNKQYLKPDSIKGHIVFKNVFFSYTNHNFLYNSLNLEIKSGESVAFVGASGCGKTTLVKLLLKFYEINKGLILFDENNINDIDPSFLRSKIGYVPQEIFFFSGTIRENISLHHPDATFDEIIKACKKANINDFINNLPNRYDTILGEHGYGLSGGERQRLALARAFLGNPSLIILDEATSNLDVVNEMEIFEIINKLHEEQITVILITHRLSTVKKCDKIYVMKNGQIIENGSHEQLVQKDGLYKQMWLESK